MGPFRVPALLAAGFLLAGAALGQQATSATPPQLPSSPVVPPGYLSQQLPQPNAQGTALLQQSLSAVGGPSSISDVTMSGTVTITKGKATDSGTIVLSAVGDAQSQVTITTPAGTRSEVRAVSAGVPSEKWTGPDGNVQHQPAQSLMTPHPAWFFPAFTVAAEPSSAFASSSLGLETRNGAQVQHVQVWSQPAGAQAASPATQRETLHDFYLDPATSLPVAMVFNVTLNTPQPPRSISPRSIGHVAEEIRFSDYRRVQGLPVPYHISVYIGGKIFFDIQITSVQINTGAAIPDTN